MNVLISSPVKKGGTSRSGHGFATSGTEVFRVLFGIRLQQGRHQLVRQPCLSCCSAPYPCWGYPTILSGSHSTISGNLAMSTSPRPMSRM